jgi:hypothetical protein
MTPTMQMSDTTLCEMKMSVESSSSPARARQGGQECHVQERSINEQQHKSGKRSLSWPLTRKNRNNKHYRHNTKESHFKSSAFENRQ